MIIQYIHNTLNTLTYFWVFFFLNQQHGYNFLLDNLKLFTFIFFYELD
jgi:hypothetical protein